MSKSKEGDASPIQFTAKLFALKSWTILLLPSAASAKLPSRGMTVVEGTINKFPFKAVLEPDGRGSHWFKLDKKLRDGAKAEVGDTVELEIKPAEEWPRPEVPVDLKKALATEPKAQALWNDITPNAQWEWFRWIRATHSAETRAHRIEVAISKLNSGMRRPCCFNRNLCSDPEVSEKWALIISS